MRIILLLFGLAFPILAFSQNLIQNPSFEVCGPNVKNLLGTPFWFDYYYFGRSYLYNTQRSNPGYIGSNNSRLRITAVEGGNYVLLGIVHNYWSPNRRVLYNFLNKQMLKGYKYYYSSYVAQYNTPTDKFITHLNKFGVKFLDYIPDTNIYLVKQPYFGNHDLENDKGFLLDTGKWHKWGGIYKAKGNESILVLGCLLIWDSLSFYPYDSTDRYRSIGLCHDAFTLIPIPELPRDTFFCEGDTLYLSPKCPPGSHYEWQTGQMGGSLAISKPGRYWVMNYSEFDTIKQWVNVKMLPNKANNPHYHICGANEFIIDLDTVYPGNITWFDGITTSLRSFTQSGIYGFNVSNGQCNLADTINLTLVNEPGFLPKTLYSCANKEVVLRASYNQIDSVYWSNGTNDDSVVLTKSVFIIRKVFDQNCIFIDSCQVVFAPKKQIEPIMAFWCKGNNLILNFDTFSGNYISEKQIQILDTGALKLVYSYGCDTLNLVIKVVEDISCGCKVFIPDAFSPNGKYPNDTFKIKSTCAITEVNFRIYNRWGQLVFQSDSSEWIMPNVPAGVYVFTWSAVLQSNGQRKNVFESGNIHVIK